MIYAMLTAGLLGLLLALYGRHSDLRFIGSLAAVAGLVVSLLAWGAW
ncbi:hypothetical protein ABZ820_12710 [Streptomyces diacarni]